MRFLLLLLGMLAMGCHPTITLQMAPLIDPAVQQWQVDVSTRLNNHEQRLQDLEQGKGRL